MNCDHVIDDFVSRVNVHAHEWLTLEEVPIPLRVPCVGDPAEDRLDETDWRIVPADHAARIDVLEKKLGILFPPSFRSLISRYSFPAFECGPLLLFANTGEPLFWELQDRIVGDPVMSPQLLAAGYLQIGNPQFYDYDPICIEARPAGVEGKVVELCHESILCDDTLVIRQQIASSFLELANLMVPK
jgi:hypothetical protein